MALGVAFVGEGVFRSSSLAEGGLLKSLRFAGGWASCDHSELVRDSSVADLFAGLDFVAVGVVIT